MEKSEILLKLLLSIVVSLFKNNSALAMENLALRQQLSISIIPINDPKFVSETDYFGFLHHDIGKNGKIP